MSFKQLEKVVSGKQNVPVLDPEEGAICFLHSLAPLFFCGPICGIKITSCWAELNKGLYHASASEFSRSHILVTRIHLFEGSKQGCQVLGMSLHRQTKGRRDRSRTLQSPAGPPHAWGIAGCLKLCPSHPEGPARPGLAGAIAMCAARTFFLPDQHYSHGSRGPLHIH